MFHSLVQRTHELPICWCTIAGWLPFRYATHVPSHVRLVCVCVRARVDRFRFVAFVERCGAAEGRQWGGPGLRSRLRSVQKLVTRAPGPKRSVVCGPEIKRTRTG